MMDSPLNVGDTTTNSILHRLQDTHIQQTITSASISSAVYANQQTIQLTLRFKSLDSPISEETSTPSKLPDALNNGKSLKDNSLIILRRLQDSYVNISQLLEILVRFDLLTASQVDKYLTNEILNNPQYTIQQDYDDYRSHTNSHLRGVWIAYDKAVNVATKFDIYEISKTLFLVDVHDFDKLPSSTSSASGKRSISDGNQTEVELASPSKKIKMNNVNNKDSGSGSNSSSTSAYTNKGIKEENGRDSINKNSEYELLKQISFQNTYAPFTLPPLIDYKEINPELISEVKSKYGNIFKKDDDPNFELKFSDIQEEFKSILPLDKKTNFSVADIPLDQSGKTALHFASTLASINLVSAFIKLGLCSPVRGTFNGESPLISTILVTNSMEKGNFKDLLNIWLWPCLSLYDKKKWTFLHHLASQSSKQAEASAYYLNTIIEWAITGDSLQGKNFFSKLCLNLINCQDEDLCNTALHIAADNDNKWLILIFIELGADINIANKTGLKPCDYDIVKEVLQERENNSFKFEREQDAYILELITTSVGIIKKKIELGIDQVDEEDDAYINIEEKKEIVSVNDDDKLGSIKIFESIQNLLNNSNSEYHNIIKKKKAELRELNSKLHDSTIVTANNRYISKKIAEKMVSLDNMKLQMANINDRLEVAKQEIPSKVFEDDPEVENTKYDADEPFRIQSIYDQIQAGVPKEQIVIRDEDLNQLPSLPILKARLAAYKEVNNKVEQELQRLKDYSELTSKFKKVVSFCTGVDINEVDELLDGLLEAVEGQQ